jgi:MFS family permease
VSASPTRPPAITAAIGAILLLAVGAALLAPLLTYPFGRDQGAFAAVADVIGRGGIPYRDAWEMKTPGVFYLYWAGFALFGRSMLAPRLLDFLFTLAAAAAVCAVGIRLLSRWAGIAAALLFIVRYVAGHGFWNTAQCEGFASLPLTLAALALVAAEGRRSRALAAVCGALIALAVIIKFTLAIFLALPLLAAAFADEPPRSRLARAASYAAGCAAVLAIAAALLWRAGALRDMIEIVFLWNAEYARLPVPFPLAQSLPHQTARFLLGLPYPFLFPVGLLALIGAVDLAARPASGRMRWFIPAWALAMMAAVWVQGKYYTYHWLPTLPPLALLAAQGLRGISAALRRGASPAAARALRALGIAVLVAALGFAYWTSLHWPVRHLLGRTSRAEFLSRYNRHGDFSLTADREVAAFLRDHTDPADPIFVWGFEPLIYFLADRPPASRFIYTIPLVTAWSPPEWRAELVRDLTRERPPLIVVARSDPLPWMTGRSDDSAAQLDGYPELSRLLHARYRPARTIEDFDIWRFEPAAPEPGG